MIVKQIIEKIGFDRAININSKSQSLSEREAVLVEEVKYARIRVDSIYFNTDENGNSFPAVFIKMVSDFGENNLKEIAEIQRKIWNYKKVLFLYVHSETEIRVYNCSEKPLIANSDFIDYDREVKKYELGNYLISDKEQLRELEQLFSRVAIDTGIVWTSDKAIKIQKKINLQKRVDKYLVSSLTETAKQLVREGLDLKLIHKIILRSLFLLYLEDRGATDEKFYSEFRKNAKSYFDILESKEATYKLFTKLEKHFNGNVFSVEKNESISVEHLAVIKKCFIYGNDGTPQGNLYEDWRIFDFSIIQIELLSEIYENFLSSISPVEQRSSGTFYTPPSLVEFILNEKLPVAKTDDNYNIKILDPSCGSGIFLVESYKRLVKRYENHYNQKLTDFDKLKKLLTDNIFGIELNPQAIKVAAFSLYLALVDNLNPKTIWQDKQHKLPNLINDPNDKSLKAQGNNLYCRNTLSDLTRESNLKNFDLVVGNPPFGTSNLQDEVRKYCDTHNFAKEMVLPFLHKSTDFAPNGKIALIFNTKVLTNTGGTYQNFRRWLFNDCYVEKVFNFSILRNAHKNFGGQLFGGATVPISIVFYQNEEPEKSNNRIAYYAPKTFIKNNVIDGLCIDFTDLKFLPREECQKPDTKIWKVAMWGGMNDWRLVQKVKKSSSKNLGDFNVENDVKSGVGFQLLTQENDKPKFSNLLSELPYLNATSLRRYYTPSVILDNVVTSIKSKKAIQFYNKFYKTQNINKIHRLTIFRRLGDQDAFVNPHILVKKGLEDNHICASYIDAKCSFRDGVYGFYTETHNLEKLFTLLAYLNSSLSTYFLFMTNSSYGIEEQIMKNEYLDIPFNLNVKQTKIIASYSEKVIVNAKKENVFDASAKGNTAKTLILENIDSVIYNSFNLTHKDIRLLKDRITYTVDLFHKQDKSKALLPAKQNQVIDYSKTICNDFNEFLEGQDLYANPTVFKISNSSPLMLIKITFEDTQKSIITSDIAVEDELKKIDQYLWEQKSTNIYFRKKLNYKTGDDIYIIRPNQRRFWSQSMALEDSAELILEILNEK